MKRYRKGDIVNIHGTEVYGIINDTRKEFYQNSNIYLNELLHSYILCIITIYSFLYIYYQKTS